MDWEHFWSRPMTKVVVVFAFAVSLLPLLAFCGGDDIRPETMALVLDYCERQMGEPQVVAE